MRNKLHFLIALALFASLGAWTLFGAQWTQFNAAAFQKAQAEGKTIVIDFHATWCPVCAQQKPILEKLIAEKEFANVVALVADYDTETALKRQMKITSQSTLVVFKGTKEVARSTGSVDPDDLRNLLRKGL